jgi:hypothetical protein
MMKTNGELCVLCGKDTHVTENTPSYMRENYIDQAGQLCSECYEDIAQNKEWHNLL